jgi:putative nucleotidyltransferase with HDIG domain
LDKINTQPQVAAQQDAAREKFIPISLESLCIDTLTNFKIYVLTEADKEPVLYRAEDLPFTDAAKKRLLENEVKQIYINSSDEENYQDYIEANLDKILSDDGIELEKKTEIVYSSATHLIKRLLDSPWMRDGVRRTGKLVENTVDFILRDQAAFSSFLAVRSHDYYTYTHSVNVYVFSVALAERLGVEKADDLKALGTGALLHDIGKSRIDKSILNKSGPLSGDEWTLIRKHPDYGVEILRKAGGVPEECYAAVRQHHERCDGSGYPEGVTKKEIHLYGRVSAIVDVFDAMTTRRSYRDAVESFRAFLTMKNQMRAGLDQTIFREFVRLMAR